VKVPKARICQYPLPMLYGMRPSRYRTMSGRRIRKSRRAAVHAMITAGWRTYL
jgi:hypothetical protein